MGIDVSNPDFSFGLSPVNETDRGLNQTAYQILVSSSAALLDADNGDLWDSGKTVSDKMAFITYEGKQLESSEKYWWKVRVWDQTDKVSEWSKTASIIMGVLNKSDWSAKWISADGAEKFAIKYKSARQDFRLSRDIGEYRKANKPGPNDPNYSSMLLRKEFGVEPKLAKAVVHVCGLGQYELNINGIKVGDYILSPGWTEYNKTVLYDTYDVTDLLQAGKNAIALILSNGMYNIQLDSVRYVKFLNSYGQLKAKLQMSLEYSDGTVKTMGTDNSWQVSPGPVIYMNEFGGEDFDARLVEKGWDEPDFSGSNRWVQAIEILETGAELKGLSAAAPPIKAVEKLTPVKTTQIKPNVWVYDLGQNVSIMPEFIVKGAKGSYIRVIPSELTKPDGTVDRTSATQDGVRPAWWQYTLVGNGSESYFPKFFYQGGRYLQVELFPAEGDTKLPEIERLNGIVVHTSATPIGIFSCANELFNRIYSLVRWAQRSNLVSTITDCPQREKMAWLEQYHLNGPSLRYNFDLLTLYRKGMNDMSDSQFENGFVPNIAPEIFFAGNGELTDAFRNSPEWGSSFIIVPWQQYLFSGDVSLIKRYFDKMKNYLAFLDSRSKENILYFGLGDWYDMGPKEPWGSQLTPEEFTATAIFFYDYKVMAKMASLIGKNEDAQKFEEKAEVIREAFNAKFYNAETGIYSTGSNTTMAMPLALNMAEPQNSKAIAAKLAADIRKNGNSFTSGDVGYRFLLKALAMEGYSDLIYEMNNQSERPGYGYQLKMGATSLTEKWDAGVGSFGSQNHFMLGQINEWFFNDLVGIGVDEQGAGFRKSIIKPEMVSGLNWVKGSYQTISGLITSEWKRENNQLMLNISIPANTTATVYIPGTKVTNTTENEMPVSDSKGVKFLRAEAGKLIFEVGSGNYQFITKQ